MLWAVDYLRGPLDFNPPEIMLSVRKKEVFFVFISILLFCSSLMHFFFFLQNLLKTKVKNLCKPEIIPTQYRSIAVGFGQNWYWLQGGVCSRGAVASWFV